MSRLVLNGDTSGSVTLDAPAVSGATTLTLPTTSGTLVVTSGAQTIEFADGSASTPSITNSGDNNTGIFFPAADTIAFTEGGAEIMRITSAGNVGIGTTNPQTKLQVVQTFGNSFATSLNATAAGSANNQLAGISFSPTFANTVDYAPRRAADIWAGFNAANWGTQYLAFGVGNATNDVGDATPERARIDASGNVGIGTASPSTYGSATRRVLSINNNDNVLTLGSYYQAGVGQFSFINSSNGAGSGNIDLVFSTGSNTERMRLSSTGGLSVGTASDPGVGAIYATGNITAFFSDIRLKNNEGRIDHALDKVSKLSGIYYTTNETAKEYGYTDESRQVGVIAQEVKEVLPEIVKAAPFDLDENGKSKSGQDYMTVQYDKLVPLLIEAIKELKAEVDALKGK